MHSTLIYFIGDHPPPPPPKKKKKKNNNNNNNNNIVNTKDRILRMRFPVSFFGCFQT